MLYILIPCKESGGYSFNVCIILYWFSLIILYLRGYVQTHGTWAELAAVLYWGDPHIQLLFHQNICLRGLQFQYFMIKVNKNKSKFLLPKKNQLQCDRHDFIFKHIVKSCKGE